MLPAKFLIFPKKRIIIEQRMQMRDISGKEMLKPSQSAVAGEICALGMVCP